MGVDSDFIEQAKNNDLSIYHSDLVYCYIRDKKDLHNFYIYSDKYFS